ncbi:MAG: hypothetical protein AABZ60_16350, partial [Planctomycetota bacterium]
TGIWYESPGIKFLEYLPFYGFWLLEQFRICSNSREKSWIRIGDYFLKVFFLVNFLVLSGFLVFQGRINLDEGYLSTAAKRTQEGRILYQETAFTQGPILPKVYGLLLEKFQYSFLTGRILTFAISLSTVALALCFSFHQGGRYALLITSFLLCWNIDYAYFSVLVKTYSLATFFLTLAVFLFLKAPNPYFSATVRVFSVLGFSWMASWTRISLFPFFFCFLGYFFYHATIKKKYLVLGFSFLMSLSIYWFYPAPFASIYFHLIQFHLGFTPVEPWGYRKTLLLKYTYENFYSFCWIALILAFGRLFWIQKSVSFPQERFVLWITGGVALFHFGVNTGQPEYQTVLYPIASYFVGIWGGRLLKKKPWRQSIWILLLIGYLAFCGFERGWRTCYGIREERWAPVDMIRYVEKCLETTQKQHALGTKVLTMDPLPVLRRPFETFFGMEMGPFSFYPDLSSAEMNRFGVVNRQKIEYWIEQKEPDIILYTSDFFARENPSLQEMPEFWRIQLLTKIQNHYERVQSIGGYGQLHQTLDIYIKKP